MSRPIKKRKYIAPPEIKDQEMDPISEIEKAESSADVVEVNYSNFSGAKLIYFEHGYSKNSADLSKMHDSTKKVAEKLPEIPDDVEDLKIRMPFRRSQRQINKSEKEELANVTDKPVNVIDKPVNIIDKPVNVIDKPDCSQKQLMATVPIKENTKEAIISETNKPAPNSSVINENKPEDENQSIISDVAAINAKISPTKELACGSSSTKDDEIFVSLEKLETYLKQQTADDGEYKKKNKVKKLRSKTTRKRAFSEPSKSDANLLAEDDTDEGTVKKKKLRGFPKIILKGKKSKKVSSDYSSSPPDVCLSSPPDVCLMSPEQRPNVKLLVLKKDEDNKYKELAPKKRRQKCKSLSEDPVSVKPAKTLPIKKCKPIVIKEPVEIKSHALTPTMLTKPKFKKTVRVITEDEPPLFSQPDVMVKVKTDDVAKKDEKNEPENKGQSPTHSDNLSLHEELNDIPDIELGTDTKFDVSKLSLSDILSCPTTDKEAPEITSEYLSEKDDFKDFDSENSLHIDESVGKIFEENDDTSKNEIKENPPDSPKSKDVSFNDSIEKADDIHIEVALNNALPQAASKDNVEDPDSDKPIAARKPRRVIKKKEFFEDIPSKTSTKARKSAGKQKGSIKKSEDDSKKGKQKETIKAEVESEDESEDDPTKLWCLCRQPHNDRFMIQCDRCEDWFHGSCVGVSRQQGRKLEKQKKEWLCPNCLKKVALTESVGIVSSPEKKIQVKETKIKAKQDESDIRSSASKSGLLLPPKKQKVPEKVIKTEVKLSHDKQVSSPATSSHPSSSTSPLKTVVPSLIRKKTVRDNVPKAAASSTSSSLNDKKGLKKPKIIKQSCVSCQAIASVNSSYCSDKCLEKHAADCLAIYKEEKGALKGSDFDSERIVVLDRVKGNMIAGDNAPTASSIVSWLKANPTFMIACSPGPSTHSKNTVQKKEVDPASKGKGRKVTKAVRLSIRKTLKNILVERCNKADDIQLSEDEIFKLAVKIEREMSSYFKDDSKYRAKYRSLMFNIKDPRNQGLFRKILKGSISPDKLVRMSPEELASMELAKWREQENQHVLDMIKRVQMEQQSTSGLLLKKTHKGEVEIEDNFIVIDDIPKSSKDFPDEPAEVEVPAEEPEQDTEVIRDTTPSHRSHLFDLNCKVCTGKVVPPPVEDNTPKKVRVAHSISVDTSSSAAFDTVEATVARIVDGKSPLLSAEDDSMDQEPTSTVNLGSPETSLRCMPDSEISTKAACSVWKGFIYMQDVAKFVTSAYKVSGQTEYLHMDVPDTIQVCGRIIPDQVWDYLGKIKQSGNKELIIIRFQAANEEEAITYNSFYSYLSSRKRYGVVSNYSKKIKDFYILPLAATSPVPIVLMPFDGPGLPSPRPHLLLGVIVRHRVKQAGTSILRKEKSLDGTTDSKLDGSYTPPLETRSYTPPLPALQTDSSGINVIPETVYSPSMDLKTTVSEEESDVPQNCITSSADVKRKADEEIYEPSYTPPLEILSSDSPKEREDEKPYDPEQDILNIDNECKDSKSSPKEGVVVTENLEKHKKILDALTRQVEETDRQVNALKQLISQPDDSDMEYHSPSTQSLDINSVASSGMSSFLDLPENLQDILNVVREKSKEKSSTIKGDVDMRISNLFKSFSSSYQAASESEKSVNSEEKTSTIGATPPLDDSEEASPAVVRPSDPRIKLRTSFQEPPFSSEEISNVSLSTMSVSELVERAEKELADIEQFDKVQNNTQNIPLSQEKLASANVDKISPSWNEFKEPPPPGIELSELSTQDSTYSKTIPNTSPNNSLPSSSSSPLIKETQQISPRFPPPSLSSTFPPPLPPGFSIQTPPPNLKSFPPPNVISTSFPPPPLPIVTKANDVNSINETWPTWNVPPQQSKDSTWQNRMPQWNENWKNISEAASVDCSESNSHYYPSGTHEFHKESYYRGESSTEGRWPRQQRFGRNNWQKRPHRGGRWRGRGSFHFNKNQRN